MRLGALAAELVRPEPRAGEDRVGVDDVRADAGGAALERGDPHQLHEAGLRDRVRAEARRRARTRSSRRRRRGCRRSPARAAPASTRRVSRKCAVRFTSRLRRHSSSASVVERAGRGDAGVEDDRVERRRSSRPRAWTSASTTAGSVRSPATATARSSAAAVSARPSRVEVGEDEVRAARGEVERDVAADARTRRR